uniref:Sulfotransferase n=1 Tax=Chenopodium quinoa TaxID=63459 RepID=A0A803L7N6_CHEQI
MCHNMAQSVSVRCCEQGNNPPKEDNYPLLANNPHELIPFLEHKVYVDHQALDLTELPSPRVLLTHLPVKLLPLSIKETNCDNVYLAKDPKDAFISLWHFSNKASKLW